MNNNVDVFKELAVKNREMFLNKLDMDIDNNYNFLKLINTSIISLSSNELINGILNIENSFFNKCEVENNVNNFMNEIKNFLISIYDERKLLFKKKKDSNDYLTIINDNQMDNVEEYYKLHSLDFINLISVNYNDFERERLDNYINIIYFNKLMKRISDNFDKANGILINNYYESRERFNLINEKTLK